MRGVLIAVGLCVLLAGGLALETWRQYARAREQTGAAPAIVKPPVADAAQLAAARLEDTKREIVAPNAAETGAAPESTTSDAGPALAPSAADIPMQAVGTALNEPPSATSPTPPGGVVWADAGRVAARDHARLDAQLARLRHPGASETELAAVLADAQRSGDEARTAAVLEAWLTGHPDDHEPRFDLAAERLRRGLFAEALPDWRRLADTNAGDPRVWHNLAIACQALGHLQEAEQAWTRHIALTGGGQEAFAYRGEVRLDLQRDADAAADFAAAVRSGADDPAVYLNLARAHERLGQYQTAFSAAERAVELAPGSAATLNRAAELAAALDAQGAGSSWLARAVAYWRRSLEIAPQQDEVRALLRQAGAAP